MSVKHCLMPRWLRPFFPKRFVAITLSKNLCWYKTQEHLDNEQIRVHEGVHAEQYARHGWIGFVIRYLWFTCRHGYWENPLEVEARNKAGR